MLLSFCISPVNDCFLFLTFSIVHPHLYCAPCCFLPRSWLVSEGLISSEGDLLDSSGVEGEWGNLPIPPSSSPQTSAPSKFSSPHRRRQRAQSSASATKVTSDTLPPAPRPMAYHHPYHPEPWTTESPIMLLLSCFSHATDPSVALVSSGIMSGLLYYLTQHQDPSSRCFRMLCRLSCNPNCLQALVRTGSVGLIYHHLCQREGGFEREERQTSRVKTKVKQLGEMNILTMVELIYNTL